MHTHKKCQTGRGNLRALSRLVHKICIICTVRLLCARQNHHHYAIKQIARLFALCFREWAAATLFLDSQIWPTDTEQLEMVRIAAARNSLIVAGSTMILPRLALIARNFACAGQHTFGV